MAAAMECWSRRATTDDDAVEHVLMRTHDRSEASTAAPYTEAALPGKEVSSQSAMQKRLLKLSRNVSEAIASLKNSLNLEGYSPPAVEFGSSVQLLNGNATGKGKGPAWASAIRNLTQLYPGSQLPDKLISSIRKHYDSLPLSYAQAGFETKEVFLHMKLIEQTTLDDHLAMVIHELPDNDVRGSVFRLSFACTPTIALPAMTGALEGASITCKKIQIFEKKGLSLGVIILVVQRGQDKFFNSRIENALKSAMKKPKQNTVKLPFGLCGCQEESIRCPDIYDVEDGFCESNQRNGSENTIGRIQLEMPLPTSSYVVAVDEWQTIRSGREEIGKWLLSSDSLKFVEQIGPNSFKGVYKGRYVGIEKLKGCDRGSAFTFKLRRDMLELMTCGHKNLQQFYGVCVDDIHGLCVVAKLMEAGTVNDLIMKSKKLRVKELMKIAVDVAEGIRFMNDHDFAYSDLNTSRILMDRHGNARLGDLGVVTACKVSGEPVEYETDGYRWLAPEIIAGDPESVAETWMSNSYSFGMVIWEMVTGETAYSAFSPVQAAVGIAACGLRPDIPKDCPQILQSLMIKCWNNIPSARPPFSEILSMLLSSNS